MLYISHELKLLKMLYFTRLMVKVPGALHIASAHELVVGRPEPSYHVEHY